MTGCLRIRLPMPNRIQVSKVPKSAFDRFRSFRRSAYERPLLAPLGRLGPRTRNCDPKQTLSPASMKRAATDLQSARPLARICLLSRIHGLDQPP